jgi:ABC-type Fe3+/spermidine/putrescine transport system ATPase subunit
MEGLRRREIRRRVAEILESLGLRGVARRRPAGLSAAERQFVALARAAVKRPRVLLLDEPLGGLDRQARLEGQLALQRLCRELGCTVILATREPEDALLLADRIALMAAGQLLQQGPARQLYDRPESRFAAAYLGAVNLLEGYAAEQGLRVPHLGLLKGEMARPIVPGEPAVLAVRPERVLLSAGALGADNHFAARLEELSYRGQDLLLHFAVEGVAAPLLARATTAGFEALGLHEGQVLTLGFEARHARILPAR